MIVFELTMPRVGSWNGRWSGADRRYIRTKDERKVPKELWGNSYCYRWDDGWGQPEYYDSFEHFVKSIIAEQIKTNYRFTQAIDRMVKDRLSEVIKKVSKEMSGKVVDEALAEMAKGNN